MSESAKRVPPLVVTWSVIIAAFSIALGATWWQRGSVADLETVIREQATLAAEQRALNARMSTMENAVSKFEERFDWIIELMRQQEARNGYRPPPPPTP